MTIGTQELPLTVEVSFANGGLLTDEAAVRNAVADALERVAKQVRGE